MAESAEVSHGFLHCTVLFTDPLREIWDNQFIIPIYQRTYSWNISQCEQLWNDIVRVAVNENVPGHFVGSIVYIAKGIYSPTTTTQLLVIDGQQRLTTLSLLLAAMAKVIDQSSQAVDITSRKIRNLVSSQKVGESVVILAAPPPK